MAETTVEKATCENCGVDVRENTHFCYNCGKGFSDAIHESDSSEPIPMPDEAKSALDDLARKLSVDELENDPLAQAAAERKRARVIPKKQKQVEWEKVEGSSGSLFLISLLILVIVTVVVFLAVLWK